MLDPDFDSMEKYADVESLNAYQELLLAGTSEKEAFKIVKAKSRDNSRTPMQWDSGEYSGFSTVDPWLSLGNTANEINVAKELQEGSIFNYYQRLIKLRKEYPIIAEGSYEAFLPVHPQIYSYIRSYEDRRLLVLNNFFPQETTIDLPDEFQKGEVLISNYDSDTKGQEITLKPYQSIAIYC